MPRKGDVCRFDSYHKKLKQPFVVYADFEVFNKVVIDPSTKMGGLHYKLRISIKSKIAKMKDERMNKKSQKESFTMNIQEHVPSGFSLLIVCSDESIMKPKQITYSKKGDEDVIKKFVSTLDEEIKKYLRRILERSKENDFYERR